MVVAMEENEKELREEALLCAMSRVLINHPAKGCLLLKEAGSPVRLLEEGAGFVDRLLKAEGAGELLFSREMMEWGRQEALWMRSKGVRLISVLSDDYPALLKECPDAPTPLSKSIRSDRFRFAYSRTASLSFTHSGSLSIMKRQCFR